jgi:predicted nucleic acid-binding protein
VRFWDTSALVPLILEEPASRACRRELRADPGMVVWILTRVEVISALRRRARDASLTAAEAATALRRLEERAARWTEVEAVADVRLRAERLLGLHPLRAADALQLGAALTFFGDVPRGRVFLTRDRELAAAAAREGFTIVEPA